MAKAKDKKVQGTDTKKAPKPRPKKATAASLKKLARIGKEAIAMAHKQFPYIKGLEEAADAAARELRTMVKPHEKFTVLGNSQRGMSGRLDEALMTIDPSNWDQLLVAIASKDCPHRRKPVTDHSAIVKHMSSHLNRMAGTTATSEADNVRALTKVGMAEHVEKIMGLLAPISVLWGVYAKAISYK